MSTAQLFATPFDRLTILPTTMNWRGTWSATQQYFTNDVAVSPINFGSYILFQVTSSTSDVDPSLDPNWGELSAASTSVNNITAGTGIVIDQTATNPRINNSGVLTLEVGAGLTKTGDAQNPVLANAGVISIAEGAGIKVDNTNPQIPIISNTGVTSIIAGGGIDIPLYTVGTPPTINNSGVLTLTAGPNITITGGSTATITAKAGLVSLVPNTLSVLTIPAGGSGQLVFFPLLTGIVQNYLANGAPDPNGIFIFNFSGTNFTFTANGGSPVLPNNVVQIAFTGPVNYSSGDAIILSTAVVYPQSVTLPLLYMNIAAARTAGLTGLTGLLFTNTTTSPLLLTSVTNGTATYYPNGLQ
jgi:hypothetical protein